MSIRFFCVGLLLAVQTPESETVNALIKKLANDQLKMVRLEALKDLAEMSQKVESAVAIPALLQCLEEKDSDICASALYALGFIGHYQNFTCPEKFVGIVLFHPDPRVRESGRSCNAFLKVSPGARTLLLRSIESQDQEVRNTAIFWLADLGDFDPKVLTALRKICSEKDWLARNNAHVALWKAKGDLSSLVRFRLEALGTLPAKVEGKGDKVDPPETELELKKAHDKEHCDIIHKSILEVSLYHLKTIGKECPQELGQELIKCLRDPTPLIRAMAARTLGLK